MKTLKELELELLRAKRAVIDAKIREAEDEIIAAIDYPKSAEPAPLIRLTPGEPKSRKHGDIYLVEADGTFQVVAYVAMNNGGLWVRTADQSVFANLITAHVRLVRSQQVEAAS